MSFQLLVLYVCTTISSVVVGCILINHSYSHELLLSFMRLICSVFTLLYERFFQLLSQLPLQSCWTR